MAASAWVKKKEPLPGMKAWRHYHIITAEVKNFAYKLYK
jgi:hypothetical protein